MTVWKAPNVQQNAQDVFLYILHALTGIYLWEFLVTSDIEANVLFGRRPFRWPLIFYVLSRYCTLLSLILGILTFDIRSPSLDCQSIYIATSVLSHLSIWLTSVNLAIKTITIWADNKYVTRSLSLVVLGQWCILVVGIITATRLPGGGCLPNPKDHVWVLTTYAYSFVIFSIVILLTIWKLRKRVGLQVVPYSHIVFRQGVGYYMIASTFIFVAIVVLILNFNVSMSAIFVVSARVVIAVVACRAIRPLSLKLGNPPGIAGGNRTQSFPIDLHTINTHQHTDLKTFNTDQARHHMESPSTPEERSKDRNLDFHVVSEPRLPMVDPT